MNGDGDASESAGQSTRRQVLVTTGVLGAGVLAGCAGGGAGSDGGGTDSTDTDGTDTGGGGSTGTDDGSRASWRAVELTDVLTGESFSIDGLSGPVVVQSFAVWCPKCERQSRTLSKVADSVTVVGLNTDPNEDAEKVRQHAQRNGFDWRFAVAPTEMTESLVDAFGPTVTNAPSTPIIVVCDGGAAEFFAGSQRSAEQIRADVAEC